MASDVVELEHNPSFVRQEEFQLKSAGVPGFKLAAQHAAVRYVNDTRSQRDVSQSVRLQQLLELLSYLAT